MKKYLFGLGARLKIDHTERSVPELMKMLEYSNRVCKRDDKLILR